MPLLAPAFVAGSVFTFSLSLGDYIAAELVGGATQMIGSIIANNFNLDLNLDLNLDFNPPLAAAFSLAPVAFVVLYLLGTRCTGALEQM